MSWFQIAMGAGGGGLVVYLAPKLWSYAKTRFIAWVNGNDRGVQ